VNPEKQGTKAAAHYRSTVDAGKSVGSACGCAKIPRIRRRALREDFDEIFAARLQEADEFYTSVTPPSVSIDEARVMRQAIAGMMWSKQFYFFDGDSWLEEHNSHPLHSGYHSARNSDWFHMSTRTSSPCPTSGSTPGTRPGTWLPHAAAGHADPDFAKEQMKLMLRGFYLHPAARCPPTSGTSAT
jgi:hypothetical protein